MTSPSPGLGRGRGADSATLTLGLTAGTPGGLCHSQAAVREDGQCCGVENKAREVRRVEGRVELPPLGTLSPDEPTAMERAGPGPE